MDIIHVLKDVVIFNITVILYKWNLRLCWMQQRRSMVKQVGCLHLVHSFQHLTVGSGVSLFLPPFWMSLCIQGAWWELNGDAERNEGSKDPKLWMTLLLLWSVTRWKTENRAQYTCSRMTCGILDNFCLLHITFDGCSLIIAMSNKLWTSSCW